MPAARQKGKNDYTNSVAFTNSCDSNSCSSPDIELVTDATLLPRVEINNLVKRYHRSSAYPSAVDNLNLTMYESQITALLGHNGAGTFSGS
jgi:ABC-type glutathione transport system ATPase component